MSVALRLLQGLVGLSSILFTVFWGWIESWQYASMSAFTSEMLPFPLSLPILIGLLTILNIEVLVQLVTSEEEKEVVLTETEKQVTRTIITRPDTQTNWNSRWERNTDEEDQRG